MVDRIRPYRAWLVRHLAWLALAAAAAVAVAVWLARAFAAEPWLLIPSLFLVGLLGGAVVGFVGLELALYLRCRAGGRHREAQVLRHQIRSFQPLVEASLLLLVLLALAPSVLLDASDPPAPSASADGPSPPSAVVARTGWLPDPPSIGTSQVPSPAPSAPEAGPANAGAATGPADGPPDGGSPSPPPATPDTGGYLSFLAPAGTVRSERTADLRTGFIAFAFPEPAPEPVTLDRLGLPEEGPPPAPPPVELRFEAMMLDPSGDEALAATRLWLDVPVDPEDSVRISGLAALRSLGAGSMEDREEFLAWQHASLTWTRRLAGYTRYAPFDLAFSAGVSTDRFFGAFGSKTILTVDDVERISPYLALDVSIWQARSYGFQFHLGQTIPANLTGGSIVLTEASLTVRYDASETVSFHTGLQVVRYGLVDYEDPLTFRHGRTAMEDLLAGPVVGIDIRF